MTSWPRPANGDSPNAIASATQRADRGRVEDRGAGVETDEPHLVAVADQHAVRIRQVLALDEADADPLRKDHERENRVRRPLGRAVADHERVVVVVDHLDRARGAACASWRAPSSPAWRSRARTAPGMMRAAFAGEMSVLLPIPTSYFLTSNSARPAQLRRSGARVRAHFLRRRPHDLVGDRRIHAVAEPRFERFLDAAILAGVKRQDRGAAAGRRGTAAGGAGTSSSAENSSLTAMRSA